MLNYHTVIISSSSQIFMAVPYPQMHLYHILMIMSSVLMKLRLGSHGKQLQLTFSYANNHRPVYKTTVIQMSERGEIAFCLDLGQAIALQTVLT